MSLDRRRFLLAGAAGAAFLGLQRLHALDAPRPSSSTFGALQPDPGGILDLPAGFTYRVIARAGTPMADGLLVPGIPDGMAAFDGGDGRVRLVCNHELRPDRVALHGSAFGPGFERLPRVARGLLYDAGGSQPSCGGTTTLIYDPAAGRVERQWLSLAGTETNCAGGPTPWGSWLSCEESVSRRDTIHARDHGYVFEVPAQADTLVAAVPLTALGRFNHEAAAVDPRSGVVYLSEDRPEGLLYRLLPDRPGELLAGGRLQALALRQWTAADTRNWRGAPQTLPLRQAMATHWIDLDEVQAPQDDLRLRGHQQGAARFARGEGLWWGRDELFLACTSGGAMQAGQVFRYRPSAFEGSPREVEAPGSIEVFVESRDPNALANCDNLTVAPWGDLLLCEDTQRHCALVGVTPQGALYPFADNAYNASELAGACFAPDGRTLFVNIQTSGLTLAIRGPFPTA